MTLQARAANAARTRTVPMFAALAPLLMFVGFDGVVHGVARSTLHQGKLIKGTPVRGTRLALRSSRSEPNVVSFDVAARLIRARLVLVPLHRDSDTRLSLSTLLHFSGSYSRHPFGDDRYRAGG